VPCLLAGRDKEDTFFFLEKKEPKSSRLLKIFLKSSSHQADNLKALREQPKLSAHMPSLLIPFDFHEKF
jgi:hypothetical protein